MPETLTITLSFFAVLKNYVGEGPHDDMHTQRKSVLKNSIVSAYNAIPNTETKPPFNNSHKKAFVKVLPLIEDLLNMPDMGPAPGSKQYIKQLTRRPHRASFADLIKYEVVMDAYVEYMEQKGDKLGRVIKKPDEVVPDGYKHQYKMAKKSTRPGMVSPTSTTCHRDIRFLRQVGCNRTLVRFTSYTQSFSSHYMICFI